MSWAVRFHLSDQRDGDYVAYALVESPHDLAIPDGCRRIELIRTNANTVAEAVFNLADGRTP